MVCDEIFCQVLDRCTKTALETQGIYDSQYIFVIHCYFIARSHDWVLSSCSRICILFIGFLGAISASTPWFWKFRIDDRSKNITV